MIKVGERQAKETESDREPSFGLPDTTLTENIPNLTPRQDASAKLVILLARSMTNPAQTSAARSLVLEVTDWADLIHLAERKFVSTHLYKHLNACAADLVPVSAMATLRQSSHRAGLAVLRNVGSLVNFHRHCIEVTSAPHAYLKGAALSRQFLLPITERFSRDVDVLIESRAFGPVLAAASAADYQVLISTDPNVVARKQSDLDFLAKYADVVTLVGADGIGIEIHRQLDKLSVNFGVADILRNTESIDLAGLSICTLSKPMHFVYAAYHHSRHFWSRLHWLSDLDGMVRSVDSKEVLAIAGRIGIQPAIEAAFELHELTRDPCTWPSDVFTRTRGGHYLKACLINLRGDLEVEQVLRKDMTLNDFMADWQISPGEYNRLWRHSWLHRLRPSVTQYNNHPYPKPLHWIYSLENAISLGKNAMTLAAHAALDIGKKQLMRRH